MKDRTLMIVIIGLICLATDAGLLYAAWKDKTKGRYFFLAEVLCLTVLSVLVPMGLLLGRDALLIAGLSLPLGTFILLLAIQLRWRYQRCNFEVRGTYIGYARHKYYCRMRFSYQYGGKTVTSYGTQFCNTGEFHRMGYEEGKTYLVFVDPENPTVCMDKRLPPPRIFSFVFAAAIFFCSGVLALLGGVVF